MVHDPPYLLKSVRNYLEKCGILNNVVKRCTISENMFYFYSNSKIEYRNSTKTGEKQIPYLQSVAAGQNVLTNLDEIDNGACDTGDFILK